MGEEGEHPALGIGLWLLAGVTSAAMIFATLGRPGHGRVFPGSDAARAARSPVPEPLEQIAPVVALERAGPEVVAEVLTPEDQVTRSGSKPMMGSRTLLSQGRTQDFEIPGGAMPPGAHAEPSPSSPAGSACVELVEADRNAVRFRYAAPVGHVTSRVICGGYELARGSP